MKLKRTLGTLVLVVFLAALVWASHSEQARAQAPGHKPGEAVLSLGHTLLNSDNSFGELAWLLPGQRWEVGAMAIGQGSTRRGAIDHHLRLFSVSRLVRPGWSLLGGKPYFRLGVAYVEGHPLVGDGNYRLGAGIRWPTLALEYLHVSSGGINDPNTGVDGLHLRKPF